MKAGAVFAQPAPPVGVVRHLLLDQPPEALRVIEMAPMTKLVHHHVAQHFGWCEQQTPVQADQAIRRAAAPQRFLIRAARAVLVKLKPRRFFI